MRARRTPRLRGARMRRLGGLAARVPGVRGMRMRQVDGLAPRVLTIRGMRVRLAPGVLGPGVVGPKRRALTAPRDRGRGAGHGGRALMFPGATGPGRARMMTRGMACSQRARPRQATVRQTSPPGERSAVERPTSLPGGRLAVVRPTRLPGGRPVMGRWMPGGSRRWLGPMSPPVVVGGGVVGRGVVVGDGPGGGCLMGLMRVQWPRQGRRRIRSRRREP